MQLIITEKPSVARDFSRVLKVNTKREGYFENQATVITWAFGHLIQLINPDAYDEQYKRWDWAHLPIIPNTFQKELVQNEGSKRQFSVIKSLLCRSDLTTVICATDAGREGELIFRYIYEEAGCNKPIQRLWISSQTDQAIRDGFKALKPGKDYEPLYHSALCRTEADWLVGMNATRAYTIACSRGNGVMSVGRVQTPVLKLIADRTRANTQFKPTPYYEIFISVKHENGQFTGKWFKGKETRLLDKGVAEETANSIQKQTNGTIHDLIQKEKKENPPLLYDLTSLQKDANRRFKYSAEHTLNTLQSLYEKHKVLTYPRTSSRYLSADMAPKLPSLVEQSLSLPAFQAAQSRLTPATITPNTRIVDDKKVTDHHAIIPTEKTPQFEQFNDDETKLYLMVIQRFLSVFMGQCIKDTTEIISQFGDHLFRTMGTIIREQGWRYMYLDDATSTSSSKKEKQEDTLLPLVHKTDPISQTHCKLEEKETKAPPLYTEASLLAAMETAGKDIEDDEVRQAMKECGLGTPATRAQIVERLIKVGYVLREKNRFTATEKGFHLIESIRHEALTSPSLTGDWEKKLNDIAKGNYPRSEYMAQIRRFTQDIVTAIQDTQPSSFSKKPIGACPLCQADVIEMKKSYSCSKWKETSCSFVIWKQIAGKEITEALAKKLLKTKKSTWLKGFKSKAGRNFEAEIVLNNEGKLELNFDRDLGSCPLCQGKVIQTQKAYSCANWKENHCPLTIWKQIAGKTLTEKTALDLIKNGKTPIIKGFKRRDSSTFDASLILKEGKAQFMRPN